MQCNDGHKQTHGHKILPGVRATEKNCVAWGKKWHV